jgi:hypothetical protein
LRDEAICFHGGRLATVPPWEWQERLEAILKEKIDVDFRDETILNVFNFLSNRSGLKFLDEIPGNAPRVSLQMKDATLEQVLNALADTLGTGKFGRSEEGITLGLKNLFKRPKWKKDIYETLHGRKISVKFEGMKLTKVLSFLADLTGLDFIAQFDENFDPEITYRADNMPLVDLLDNIDTLSGCGWAVDRQAIYLGAVPAGRDASPEGLGLKTEDVDGGTAEALGLPDTQGAVVSEVTAGSIAAEAGLEKGDVILDCGRFSVYDGKDFYRTIRAPFESPFKLRVMRNGSLMTMDLKVPEKKTP